MKLRVASALALSWLAPSVAMACHYQSATAETECCSSSWMTASGVGLLLGLVVLLGVPRMSLLRSLMVLVAPALGLMMVSRVVTMGVGEIGWLIPVTALLALGALVLLVRRRHAPPPSQQ